MRRYVVTFLPKEEADPRVRAIEVWAVGSRTAVREARAKLKAMAKAGLSPPPSKMKWMSTSETSPGGRET
jgi:hypothetical protein